MVHDLRLWEQLNPPAFPYDLSLIDLFSPHSRSLPEVRTLQDLEICKRIYARAMRIGDNADGWDVVAEQEVNMTTGTKNFKGLDHWCKNGAFIDSFGLIRSGNVTGVPIYEGRMVGQHDPSQKGWIAGKGRSAKWRDIPFENKQFEPQYALEHRKAVELVPGCHKPRVAYMRIASATNERTMFATYTRGFCCGDTAPTLSFKHLPLSRSLLVSGVLNSFAFDFVARQRVGGLHLDWHIVRELPLPKLSIDNCMAKLLIFNTASLNLIQRRFAIEWLCLSHANENMGEEWKLNWSVTEADRLRKRIEIDALVAEAFGLEVQDYEWIVRADANDPKGFHRVDKELPYEERLTGLAARAFRALKDCTWSAMTVNELSNDDFFEMLGVPEMTSESAAHCKGLPGPLILKRNGCHSWHPERFTQDDPRYGWTWEHCRQDAVALLGSEQAVDDYVAAAIGEGDSKTWDREEADEAPFQLIADPAKKKDHQPRFKFDE